MQRASRPGSVQFAAMAVLLLLQAGAAHSQGFEPVKIGDGVLFIGNSFTSFYGPLPSAIEAVQKAADPFVCTESSMDNAGKACGILKEYVVLDSASARVMRAIREARWKYVVLQTWEDAIDQYDVVPDESASCSGAPHAYPQNQDTLIKYFKILDDSIKAVNAKTVLYAPHQGSYNYLDQHQKAEECYERLFQEADVPYYVPVFWSWDSVMADYPPDNWRCPGQTPAPGGFIEMLYADCGHQNPTGMALDAFTWYTVLTGGASAVGLNPRFPSGGVTVMPDTSLFGYLAGVGCATGRRILANMGYTDDLEPPARPEGLTTSNKTATSITLTWSPATDNVGVSAYRVLVDGIPYDTTSSTSLTITGVDMSSDHNLTVQAFDAAGHTSLSSYPVSTGIWVRFEAENQWRSYPDRDASINGFVSGHSGPSCVRVRTVGAMVVFQVYCPTAGGRTVDLRYNIFVWSGETNARNISIHVNGDSITDTTLTTAGNGTYSHYVRELVLQEGNNTIAYRFEPPDTALADTGEINIDCLDVEYDDMVGIRPIAAVESHLPALRGTRICPNRPAGSADITISSTGQQDALITVTSVSGRCLQSSSAHLSRGDTTVRLRGEWLWNQLCLVTVATTAGTVTRPLLLMR